MKTRIRRFLFHLNSFITRHRSSRSGAHHSPAAPDRATTRLLEGEFSPFTPEYFQYNPHTLWDNKPEFSFTKQTGAGTVGFRPISMDFAHGSFKKETARNHTDLLLGLTTGAMTSPLGNLPERLNQRLANRCRSSARGDGITIASAGFNWE